MSHYIHVELGGCTYSPVNPDWPSIGPFTISYDFSGGQYTYLSGQTVGIEVDNFQMTLNGAPFATEAPVSGIVYLSQQQSGMSVSFPTSTFVWNFYGPLWARGTGGLMTESNAFDFSIKNVAVSYHFTQGNHELFSVQIPEPPLISPLTCLLFLLAIFRRTRATPA